MLSIKELSKPIANILGRFVPLIVIKDIFTANIDYRFFIRSVHNNRYSSLKVINVDFFNVSDVIRADILSISFCFFALYSDEPICSSILSQLSISKSNFPLICGCAVLEQPISIKTAASVKASIIVRFFNNFIYNPILNTVTMNISM